jgi:hypothetical protein
VGVGVRNSAEPAIVLGSAVAGAELAELRFRLAQATAIIAMGLAVVEEGSERTLEDVLEALERLADPEHEPTRPGAVAIADRLFAPAAHELLANPLDREALAELIAHRRSTSDGIAKLGVELHRAALLFATRLSGQLDGALLTLAHDQGLADQQGRPDPVGTLRSEDVHWLLRNLGLY